MEEIKLADNLQGLAPSEGLESALGRSFGIRSWFQELLETLILIVLILFVATQALGRYQVYGQSMEPSLHDQQYLIASKVTYWLHPPERGDVIVLQPPADLGPIPYVKRVIGLPGDRVEIYNQRVWINGIALDEPYIKSPPNYEGTWVLGADQYFVLGDNRTNSRDSHSWGLLPRNQILGKAIFCNWPPKYWGAIPHYTYQELEAIQ